MTEKEIRASMTKDEAIELSAKIEAILFASGCPVEYEKISSALLKPQSFIEEYMKTIMVNEFGCRGIELVCHEKDAILCSRTEYEEVIKNALNLKRSGTLSNSSLEVLAIVARNQPVTKSFIEQVRGVDCTYVVNTLLDKGFLKTVGKLDVPGKPYLYSTTDNFLVSFGITSVDELTNMINEDDETIAEV